MSFKEIKSLGEGDCVVYRKEVKFIFTWILSLFMTEIKSEYSIHNNIVRYQIQQHQITRYIKLCTK